MPDLPSGTVTFLFSDVEGSTKLLERHGTAMGAALARHHALFEQIVESHGGAIFETVGDAVYAAFGTAGPASAAALDAHRALAVEDWGPIGRLAVRIALHSGAVERRGEHYFGPALFRTARLQALGYGEQTLMSAVSAGHLDELDSLGYDGGPYARAIFGRIRGRLEAECGDFDVAAIHFDRSEADARQSGNLGNVAAVLGDHGMADLWRGDRVNAKLRLTESANLAREVDVKGVLGPALAHLGGVAAREGNVSEARAALTEALEVMGTLGGAEYLEVLLDAAAWLALANGDAAAAAQLLEAAAVRWGRIEAEARTSDRHWHAALIRRVDEVLGPTTGREPAIGSRFSDPEAIGYALAVLRPGRKGLEGARLVSGTPSTA